MNGLCSLWAVGFFFLTLGGVWVRFLYTHWLEAVWVVKKVREVGSSFYSFQFGFSLVSGAAQRRRKKIFLLLYCLMLNSCLLNYYYLFILTCAFWLESQVRESSWDSSCSLRDVCPHQRLVHCHSIGNLSSAEAQRWNRRVIVDQERSVLATLPNAYAAPALTVPWSVPGP